MFCTKCGAQMSEASTFCTSCGAKVEASAAVQPVAMQPAQGAYQNPAPAYGWQAAGKKKIPMWAFIAGGAVVILIVILAIALGGSSGDKGKIKSTLSSFEKAVSRLDYAEMSKYTASSNTDYIIEAVMSVGGYATMVPGVKFTFSISLGEINVQGSEAYVDAEMIYTVTVFGQKETYREDAEIRLVKSGGKWLISDIW